MERRFVPVVLAPMLLLCAQSPLPPATSPPPAPVTDPAEPTIDEIMFGEAGTRMTVPVQIAGAGPYGFVIDTGAQRTVIARELASKLGLARGRSVRLTAMTETSDVGTVMIPSISVSTLGGLSIEAPALGARNLGAAGMLGIDSLQRHSLAIDFEKQTMAVSPSNRRTKRQRALPGEIVVTAKNMYGQLVVTDAFVNGKRVRVILDTGSAVTMGNQALRKRIARRDRKVVPIELISVTGGTLTADYGRINDVKIGEVTIADLPIAFADAAPFRVFGLEDTPALLLGMDALKLFRRVNIDFANRELRLALPKNAREEFRPGWSAAPG
jgi:predicted aspartyl protease